MNHGRIGLTNQLFNKLNRNTPYENKGKISSDYALPQPDDIFGRQIGGKKKWLNDYPGGEKGLEGWLNRVDRYDAKSKLLDDNTIGLQKAQAEQDYKMAKRRALQAAQAGINDIVNGERYGGLPSRMNRVPREPRVDPLENTFHEAVNYFQSQHDASQPYLHGDELLSQSGISNTGTVDVSAIEDLEAAEHQAYEDEFDALEGESSEGAGPSDPSRQYDRQYLKRLGSFINGHNKKHRTKFSQGRENGILIADHLRTRNLDLSQDNVDRVINEISDQLIKPSEATGNQGKLGKKVGQHLFGRKGSRRISGGAPSK